MDKVMDILINKWYTDCLVYNIPVSSSDIRNIVEELREMIKEKKEMKKYTLKEWKEFCKDALIMPPFEDDEQVEEWFKTHKIHIATNNCVMELEYDADAVNELEFSLGEIYEAIHGSGKPTTGNTMGSEYRDATWKDILRFAVLDGFYEDSHSLEVEIDECINRFTPRRLEEIMKKINEQTSMNDELKVNFFKLETEDLWKIFYKEERRKAFKEILCSNVELSEMINEKGGRDDIVVIMDYSILPFGNLVGWHYGVDWDINSDVNQSYINDYIKGMIGND